MKNIFKITAIALALAGTFSCEKQHNPLACESLQSAQSMQGFSSNCLLVGFLDGVSKYSKCSNLYIVKGIALEQNEYGRKIKLEEDLKGNFPKGITAFMTWGGGANVPNRLDYLNDISQNI